MACCRPSTIAKAHLGSSAYTILIAKTCAQKQSVDARDVRCLATRARDALIYKEIASWAARNAFPKWQEGRHPHCHFRGLLRLHSRYGPPDRSAAHRRPLSRGSNPCGYPHKPLVSYRINRQLSGWIPPPLMIRAFGAHCQERTFRRSLDHLVGAREQRDGRVEAERLGGLQINGKLVFGRKLDRQIAGLCTFENAVDVRGRAAETLDNVNPVGSQAAFRDEVAVRVDCWQAVAGCERNDLVAMG